MNSWRGVLRLAGLLRQTRAYNTATATPAYVDRVPGPKDHVYIAMSSGVDSSTAAALLAANHPRGKVSGIYMANWSSTAKCAEADWNDVLKVCDKIGIECERVNFEREYWTDVFEPMIEMYRKGYTPNPDVGCNRYIKFGQLMKHLEAKHGRNDQAAKWWLATGHYARVAQHVQTGSVHLLRPLHLPKDQSYYLSSISASVLPRVLFPLAHYTKPQVRELAKNTFDLPTAEKPDSQGLCFVSQSHNSFREFLSEYLPPNPGNVVTDTGEIVGKHQGIWHATVGQKSGIAMPQGDPSKKGTWYVKSKDFDSNTITIVRGVNNPAFYAIAIHCQAFDWLGDVDLDDLQANNSDISIQYRSLQVPEPVAGVKVEASGGLTVRFKTPRRAVAAGQYLVMYNSAGRVLGSGVIAATDMYESSGEEVLHDKLLQHA